MFLLLLISTAICLVIWLLMKWQSVKNYWKVRGVPYLPPNPIFGSLTFIQRQNPGLWLRQLYKLNSPYVGIWFFWRPGLVVNSPEIARRVLVKDFGNFKNRYMSSGDTDPLGGLNLLTVNDPIWSSIRRRLTSVFTAAKLRILEDYTISKSMELKQRIQNDKSGQINLKVMFVDYTTDIIGTSAFGLASNSTLTGKGLIREITREFGNFTLFRALSWCSIFFFPDLVDVFRFKFFPKSSSESFRKIIKTVSKQREGNEIRNSNDLLDALLKLKKESTTDSEAYSEDFVVAQAAIFLLGGFETSGSILSFLAYELAFNIEVQDKLFVELRDAKERIGNNYFDSQILAELTYLNCVIKEALRKYSPMGWLDRIAIADYQIDDKLTIKAGTPVYINSIGLHYHPELFPEPTVFNPDRFLPENEHEIKQYTYMPFGEGPRICIGMRFAMMTMRFALASVFLNFEVRPSANSPPPADVKIDSRGLLYFAGEPLLVDFVPRA